MRKVLVIGASGSGKSTLAKRIADRLGIPFFPTDGFYWEPGWTPAPPESVRKQISAVLAQDAWVMDGNFDDLRETVWPQSDLIAWLDYPLPLVLFSVTRRNLGWFLSHQQTWSGNRMSLARAFSGIRHAAKSHALKRRDYPVWLGGLPHTTVARLRSRAEADGWLETLKP